MDQFLDISSLGATYNYVVEIERKFQHKGEREFAVGNQPKNTKGEGNPNFQNKVKSGDNQPHKNQPNLHADKKNGKPKSYKQK
jgi:hypothetical protein